MLVKISRLAGILIVFVGAGILFSHGDVVLESDLSQQTPPEKSNRDLFLEAQDEPQASPKVKPTVKFWVERENLAHARDIVVDNSEAYQTGDKVWFKFSANVSGYAYLINRGSSGTVTLLFPGLSGKENDVDRFKERVIPSVNSPFIFTGEPGVESLALVLSPERIPELEDIAGQAKRANTTGLSDAQDRSWSKKLEEIRNSKANRDLVLQSEDDGNYATDHGANGFERPIVVYTDLIHIEASP